MLNVETVCVVGLGYVGLPSAALMAQAGYKVRGVDVNAELVADLELGHCRIGEAAVQGIVTATLADKSLTARTKPCEADAFFICVPTPITADKGADVSMVRSAMQSIAPYVRAGNMIVLESTSPLNTTQNIVAAELRAVGIDPYKDVDVCYCPERVFPGNTVNEILNNDRVVGGLTPKAAGRAKVFYESFCKGHASETSASAAEFSKLMENTFRDVNIALANVFGRIAEDAGVDVAEVIAMANRHPRVNVHTPGPGVGGHCIPVDPWFLIDAFPEAAGFLRHAREINDGQARHILERAKSEGLAPGSKVAILGAAYRGDIDDARDTPTDLLIDALKADGFTWQTHDPFVETAHSHWGHDFHLSRDLADVVSGASLAIIMTDHKQYRALTPAMVVGMKHALLFDTRSMIDHEAFANAGFCVLRVGAPSLKKA